MAYQITVQYGDFVIQHDDEDDALSAMKLGVYGTALTGMVSKVTALLESGLLVEPPQTDVDRDLQELIAGEEEDSA